MTTTTTTDRGDDMNKNGRRLDAVLAPLSVENGTEIWSQWDTKSFFVVAKDDDGKRKQRKCACGKGLYQYFSMQNRSTGEVVPIVGMNCIMNHFPIANYKKAKQLKQEHADEMELCDLDTVRDLEYKGKYRCCCRPCRKYGDDPDHRFCKAHRELCTKQADIRCKKAVSNKCIKNNTWGEMLDFDVEWCDGSYIKHMLRKGYIACQYLRAYLVNEMLNRGYKLAEWKADMKPVLE